MAPFALSKTIYTLTINTNIRSASGNPIKESYSTSFTSLDIADVTPPTLSSSCNQSGASCVAASWSISPVSAIQFNFSEPMLPASVNSGFSFTVNGSPATYAPTWSNNNQTVVYTFSNLSSGTAIINLTNTATDASGNALSKTITNQTFTIGAGNIIDYTVSTTNFPANGSPNAAFSGRFTIQNTGIINGANTVNWSVVRSTNTTLGDGDDVTVQTGTQPALNGGATSPTINYSGT